MKKLFVKLLIYLLKKAFYGSVSSQLQLVITDLYKEISLSELKIKTEILKIKKGKAKYHVAFFKDKNLSLKCTMWRHIEENCPIEIDLN